MSVGTLGVGCAPVQLSVVWEREEGWRGPDAPAPLARSGRFPRLRASEGPH